MPTNKKEGLLYGICMCFIMAYGMALLNISINMNGFNFNSILATSKAFPMIFVIAFIIENTIVHFINGKLIAKFTSRNDSQNAHILFNTFFIVTMMSIIMTIIGGLLSNGNIAYVLNNFFSTWPRNFCSAMFLNLIVAGPISRFILSRYKSFASVRNSIND